MRMAKLQSGRTQDDSSEPSLFAHTCVALAITVSKESPWWLVDKGQSLSAIEDYGERAAEICGGTVPNTLLGLT